MYAGRPTRLAPGADQAGHGDLGGLSTVRVGTAYRWSPSTYRVRLTVVRPKRGNNHCGSILSPIVMKFFQACHGGFWIHQRLRASSSKRGFCMMQNPLTGRGYAVKLANADGSNSSEAGQRR